MEKEFKVKCKDCQVGEPYIMNPKKEVLCEGKILAAGKKRICSIYMAKSLKVPRYLMREFVDKIHYRLKWMTGKEVIKNNKTAEKRELVVNEGGKDGETNSNIAKQPGIVQRLSKMFLPGQDKKAR